MIIIRLIRWLTGYVSFKAEGGFAERFVNLCTLRHIPLWNLKRDKNCLYAETTVKGYKSIRLPASRSGARVKMTAKKGLPFFINSNRKRRGLLIGLFASFAVVILLHSMLWSITVTGNKNISEEEILKVFEAEGVKIGALKSRIDVEKTAYNAQKAKPEILWASVNIKGSRAEIVVKEVTPSPEFPNTDIPMNVVACEDGEITAVNASVGEEAVKVGDLVLKGDLLISGTLEYPDGTTCLVSARGGVKAKVDRSINISDGNFVFNSPDRLKKRYSLSVLGLEIPLSFFAKSEHTHRDEAYLIRNGIKLPLGMIRDTGFDFGEAKQLTEEKTVLYIAKIYSEKAEDIYKSTSVLSCDFSFDSGASQPSVSASFRCEKDIGEFREIFIEK